MRSKLLLHLLTARPRTGREAGFTMLAGILVILALVVGTLGVVAIVNGANLGTFGSGEARDSQQVAEAGADQIIATFNQPENRQLLVAGSTAPNTWSTSNAALQSPCLSSGNKRPGANNGFPTSQAVSFADGKFRNLEDITKTDAGTRRFVLKAVRYSAGTDGTTDRRSIYVGYKADGTALTTGGTIPSGTTFNSLVNLNSSSGTNPAPAGTNSGFIAVEVEGRLYRADGTYSSSTITKEYEVMPKCCGGSFGSQGSGGSSTGLPFGITGSTGALGADSRYCGLEWGMITGLNNGRFFSQAAFRRYTRVNDAGNVVAIGSILGIIANKGDTWDRKTMTKATITVPPAGGGFSYTGYIGCRTIPSPCNDNNDVVPVTGYSIAGFYSPWTSTPAPTPGLCPDVPTLNTVINTGTLYTALGDQNSIDGKATSCIPIVPLYLSSGLPSIASKYTYVWTSGGNPETISKSTATTASNIYPIITALAADNPTQIWLRANRATALDQKASTGSAPYTPFVEYCNTKYLASNKCATSTTGDVHTWAIVSKAGAVIGGIQDSFTNNNFTSYDSTSTPRWPTVWQTNTSSGLRTNGTASSTDLNFTDTAGSVTFKNTAGGTASWGTNFINAPAIARAVNLYGLQGFTSGGTPYGPVLEFTFTTKGSGVGSPASTSALRLDYSFDGTSITTDSAVNTDTGWVQLGSTSANGTWTAFSNSGGTNFNATGSCTTSGTTPTFTTTCRIAFPPAAVEPLNRFSHYVKFRLRANSNFSATVNNALSSVALTSVSIKGDTNTASANYAPQYKNWCEYSPTFPITDQFTNGFHCVGPTINVLSSGNNLWMDTTDGSISLYYNSNTDTRGNTNANPVINLAQGGSLSNVQCPRASSTSTAPTDNCTTNVAQNVYSTVGQYDYFNIFGRDTPPGTNCTEMGLSNQPCNQIVVIGTDASSTAANRSVIAGAWFYLPWGNITFSSNGCSPIPSLADSVYYATNSWNFAGRIWTRTLLACGQNHFRVPPSSANSLDQLIGGYDANTTSLIGWKGIDWVARSPTGTRKGFSLN
ncbi:MAG: hypothetical protein WCK64_13545 [Synechococcaceae cyanobacterium ELA445]